MYSSEPWISINNYKSSLFVGVAGLSLDWLRSISFCRIQSKARSVTCSTGWSNRNGSIGTIARPVTVGPQVLILGFVA